MFNKVSFICVIFHLYDFFICCALNLYMMHAEDMRKQMHHTKIHACNAGVKISSSSKEVFANFVLKYMNKENSFLITYDTSFVFFS